jgi:molybdopterin-guanine dinucleotide biosynthesis protein
MLVVIGGNSRNIGKTSVIVAIIRATPFARWTAIKITQTGHGVCSTDGEPCACETRHAAHPYAIDAETEPGETDSRRFLAAGAAQSFWVRTRAGQLAHAMPEIRRLISVSPHTIVESNSLLDFLVPDLYVPVLDFSVPDLKASARRFLDRANALAIVGGAPPPSQWQGISARSLAAKPVFRVDPPRFESSGLADLICSRLSLNPE